MTELEKRELVTRIKAMSRDEQILTLKAIPDIHLLTKEIDRRLAIYEKEHDGIERIINHK